MKKLLLVLSVLVSTFAFAATESKEKRDDRQEGRQDTRDNRQDTREAGRDAKAEVKKEGSK